MEWITHVCGWMSNYRHTHIQPRYSVCIATLYIHFSVVPSPLSAFFTCRKKTREDLVSKVMARCHENGVTLASPLSVDFKPVRHLQFINHSSTRPPRIVLPSTMVVGFLHFTRVEPECSKIVLAHMQFSRSATLPTLVYGPT